MLFFFVFITCIFAQTEFQLPPVVKWENLNFQGFVLFQGSTGQLLETHGELKYRRFENNRVANRATFVFTRNGDVVLQDTLTLWPSPEAAPTVYQIVDSNCTKSNLQSPKCGSWQQFEQNNWKQICVETNNGRVLNMTTVVTLDATNHFLSLKYNVVVEGTAVASLAITRTSGSASAPDDKYFTPPSSCADPSDPFSPSSCTGLPLNLASKFVPGSKAAALVNYTLAYGQRTCTKFTGCSAWVSAKPSWGPSGTGTIWLKVTASGISVALVDRSAGSSYGTPVYNLGADCTLANNLWNCGQYHDTEVREGVNFLRFGGSDKFHGVSPVLSGSLLDSCAWFGGSVQGPSSDGSWTEYRVGLLAHY